MNKAYLELEKCRCRKIEKEVTITSMIIEDEDPNSAPHISVKQAFDCDQISACGVLTILGKMRRLNWAGCTHPDLAEVSESGDD